MGCRWEERARDEAVHLRPRRPDEPQRGGGAPVLQQSGQPVEAPDHRGTARLHHLAELHREDDAAELRRGQLNHPPMIN